MLAELSLQVLLKQDSLSSKPLDYMSEFGPVMEAGSALLMSCFVERLDSQTFFILNVVFYVIGTGI